MNKFLIIALIISTLPTLAACKIDGSTSCSIAELTTPQLQGAGMNLEAPSSGIHEMPVTNPTSPQNAVQKDLRNFGAQEKDYSYSSNCQFGICSSAGQTKLFNERK